MKLTDMRIKENDKNLKISGNLQKGEKEKD